MESDSLNVHLLTDNEDISHDEYAKASVLLGRLRSLHLETRQYVERRGLDAEIFLPGNIWAEINSPDTFINWTYDLVNYAKCISPFTGFHQMMWGRMDMPGQVDSAKASAFYARFFSAALDYKDVDGHLEREFDLSERIRRDLPQMAESYDALVSTIPKRYRILAPPCGGEIGGLHNGRILNPDIITYQKRVNAMYAAGALKPIEDAIATHGVANYLEIGPGHCLFAYALAKCFEGRLNVVLIDLPFVMSNACAYLSCAAGADRIGLVTEETTAPVDKPFVFVPNYLLPDYEHALPRFQLVHNAMSLVEMTPRQVSYYFDLVERLLAPDGVFHIAGGLKMSARQIDAVAAAIHRFPDNHVVCRDRHIAGHFVGDRPNTFIRC